MRTLPEVTKTKQKNAMAKSVMFSEPTSSSTLEDVIRGSRPPAGVVTTKRLGSLTDTESSASEPTQDPWTPKFKSAISLPSDTSTFSKESPSRGTGESSGPPPARTPDQPPTDAAPLVKKQGTAASAVQKNIEASGNAKRGAPEKRQPRSPFLPGDCAPRTSNQSNYDPKPSPCTALVERQDTAVSLLPERNSETPASKRALQESPTVHIPQEAQPGKRLGEFRQTGGVAPTVGASTTPSSTTLEESLVITGPKPEVVTTRRLQSLEDTPVSTSSSALPDLSTITTSSTSVGTSETHTSSKSSSQRAVGESDKPSSARVSRQPLTDTYATVPNQGIADSARPKKPEELTKTPKHEKKGLKKKRSKPLELPPGSGHRLPNASSADVTSPPCTALVERQYTAVVLSPERGSKTPASVKASEEGLGVFLTKETPAENQHLQPHELTSERTIEQENSQAAKKDTQAFPATTTIPAASEIPRKPAITFEKSRASFGFSAPAEGSLSKDCQNSAPKPSLAKAPGEKETTAVTAPEALGTPGTLAPQDLSRSKEFSKVEKEGELASREQPPEKNLSGVGATLNSNAKAPIAESAPTCTEPSFFTPFEFYTSRMMGTGIPVAVPANEDSGRAGVRKEALKDYLSSHAASTRTTQPAAVRDKLPEEAAVRTQWKDVPTGTDRLPPSYRSPFSTTTPVNKPTAASTIEEIKGKEKQAPELHVTYRQQPTGKQEIETSEREVVVIREKKTPVLSRGVTKPTYTSTARDHSETSTGSSSSTQYTDSQYSATLSSSDRPIALARRGVPKHRRAPQRAQPATGGRERFRAPTVKQLISGDYGLYVIALSFGVVLIVILGILFWPTRQRHAMSRNMVSERSGGTCTSPSCVKNALYLGDLLSWSDGRPCDDFYAFVCSRWTSRFPLSPNSSSSTDDDYVMTLEDQIYGSLEKEFRSSVILQPLKALHDACMDAARSQHQGQELLNSLMSYVSLGGFPLSGPMGGTVSVWTAAARILRKTGTLALLSVSVATKPEEKAGDIISLGPPELLTSGRVDAEEVLHVYTKAVFSAVRIFNKADIQPAEIIATVRFAIEIEKLGPLRLKGSFWNIDRRRRSGSDLLEFVTEVFRGSEKWAFNSTLSKLIVWSPGFTNDVLGLVENAAPHTVMNYLGIRLLIQIAPFMPDSELIDAFSILVHGRPHPSPSRWKVCLRVAEKALYPLVYASLFAHGKLRASRSHLTSFAQAIVDEFISEIENSPHFDRNSKDAIYRILSSSEMSLIGPTWSEHAASIQDYVDRLPDPKATKSVLDMYMSYYEHTFFYALSRGSRGRWRGSAFSTDCWYEAHPRTLHVPLLAFNVTQVFDDGAVNAMQASRLAPRLSRCLFDMLLDETDSANSSADYWLTEDTWKRLLAAEACLAGRQDFLRLGRFRDVLAVQVALRVFEKTASASDALRVRLQNDYVVSSSQVFFAYVMLQSCEKSGYAGRNTRPAASDEWRTALLNNDRFRSAFNCSKSPVPRQPSQCFL